MSKLAPDLAIDIMPHLLSDAHASDALRAALQVPVQLRFYGARTTTFLGGILLAQDPDIREMAFTSLQAAVRCYGDLADVMDAKPRDAPIRLHEIVVDLCATVTPRHPAARAAIRGYETMILEHVRTIAAGGRPSAGAFDAVLRYIYSTFHPAVLTLSSAMVEAGTSFRAQRDASALRARDRALQARERIDDISRTVRLISLNARVEAARAGAAGRAFGVIAEEIKALSEQTEEASEELASSVRDMMANVRAI